MYPLKKPNNPHFRGDTTACSFVPFTVAPNFGSRKYICQLVWESIGEWTVFLSFFLFHSKTKHFERLPFWHSWEQGMEPSGGRAKVPLVTLQLGWAGLGLCILCMDMCVLWQPGHTGMFFL